MTVPVAHPFGVRRATSGEFGPARRQRPSCPPPSLSAPLGWLLQRVGQSASQDRHPIGSEAAGLTGSRATDAFGGRRRSARSSGLVLRVLCVGVNCARTTASWNGRAARQRRTLCVSGHESPRRSESTSGKQRGRLSNVSMPRHSDAPTSAPPSPAFFAIAKLAHAYP